MDERDLRRRPSPTAWRRWRPSPTCSCLARWASATRRSPRRSITRSTAATAEDWVGRGTGRRRCRPQAQGRGGARGGRAATSAHLDDPLEVLAPARRARDRRDGRRDPGGADAQRMPVVLDGFVVCAAAAVLQALDPAALDHCLAGPCLGRAGASRSAGAARQGAAARSRHAARRGLRRGARRRRRQGGGRLPQRHGDLRGGRGGGEGSVTSERRWRAGDAYAGETIEEGLRPRRNSSTPTRRRGRPSVARQAGPTSGKRERSSP